MVEDLTPKAGPKSEDEGEPQGKSQEWRTWSPRGVSLGQERAKGRWDDGLWSQQRELGAAEEGCVQLRGLGCLRETHLPSVCSVRCQPGALQQTPKCCEVSLFPT